MSWKGRETRRSQSVVQFGIGAIVEFQYEALMLAGLDAWIPVEKRDTQRLTDDRLARRLGVEGFRLPPPKYDEFGVKGTMKPLPYVRFPQWHYCPRCRFLKKASLHDKMRPQCDNEEHKKGWNKNKKTIPCGKLKKTKRPRMQSSRFVAVCKAGHIEDFPWNAWAHREKGEGLQRGLGCLPERLYFYSTGRGGLSGLKVYCNTCESERTLFGVTGPKGLKGFECSGYRPWLGKDASEICTEPLDDGMLALQRGASNIYYPEVKSSILIPPFSSKVFQVLRNTDTRRALQSAHVNGEIPDHTFKTIGTMKKVDPAELKRAWEAEESGELDTLKEVPDETTYRQAEYQALRVDVRDKDDDLACRKCPIDEYEEVVQKYFEQVTLVERLAETRVLTGFSRIIPQVSAKLSRTKVGWLPGFRVHGEGIFLQLNQERLKSIRQNSESRLTKFLNVARSVITSKPGLCELELSSQMILLHTLSHLLIKRLSYEAGYGASSIRERIYSSTGTGVNSMAGILLYTAAGDADGTLGGLVGLGRPGRLERVVAGAMEDVRWCAADPVCAESPGQGPESLNLAACHACSLIAETSCELQNRFLDRGTVKEFFETP